MTLTPTTLNLPIELNFYDITKLSSKIGESTIPGLSGTLFSFDDYLKAKLSLCFLQRCGFDCTPLFFLNKSTHSFVAKTMSFARYEELKAESDRIRASMVANLQLSIDQQGNIGH